MFQVIEKRKLTRSEGPFERGKGLKETRPLWPPQRGVGLREPNLGKTNLCVTLHLLVICFSPSLADSFIFLTLTRLVVVFIFVNFSFALFTPPLGDFHKCHDIIINLRNENASLIAKVDSNVCDDSISNLRDEK